MNNDEKTWLHWPFVRLISPWGFVKVALAILSTCSLLHLLGWREKMTFMSGTMSQDFASTIDVFMGLLYGASYVGMVVFVPVLLLGSVIFKWLSRYLTASNS